MHDYIFVTNIATKSGVLGILYIKLGEGKVKDI